MTEPMTSKAKHTEQPLAHRGAVAPRNEFPFFLSRIRDEFERLLEGFSREWANLWEGRGWRWGLNLRDLEDAVVVEAEAPGFEVGDFDIQVTDSQLVLRASKKVETKDEKGKVSEYRELKCFETITLPAEVDKEKVEATYRNGILTVTLPKSIMSKAKKIAVKAG